jgi:hypothetical protein
MVMIQRLPFEETVSDLLVIISVRRKGLVELCCEHAVSTVKYCIETLLFLYEIMNERDGSLNNKTLGITFVMQRSRVPGF